MAGRDLARIADELYGLEPAEFTAARNEAAKTAKTAGDADLAAALRALPKPSTAAWLVNQLTRRRPADLDGLLAVGDALREATAAADAASLKDLNAKRRAVLAAMGRAALALARELGHPAGDSVAREVEATLHAGLVDAAAGAAVRSGRLARALAPAGFGAVDLAGAVAAADGTTAPSAPAKPKKAEKTAADETAARARAAALEQAWAAAAAARAALESAGADATEAETGLGLATAHREQIEADVEEAAEALRAAREALADAERAEGEARNRQRAAQKALDAAQRSADRSAAALRDLQEP
ncbi:MAG: hypothetical protein ACT4QF_09140 [Sporichthyaceae bacterium]